MAARPQVITFSDDSQVTLLAWNTASATRRQPSKRRPRHQVPDARPRRPRQFVHHAQRHARLWVRQQYDSPAAINIIVSSFTSMTRRGRRACKVPAAITAGAGGGRRLRHPVRRLPAAAGQIFRARPGKQQRRTGNVGPKIRLANPVQVRSQNGRRSRCPSHKGRRCFGDADEAGCRRGHAPINRNQDNADDADEQGRAGRVSH